MATYGTGRARLAETAREVFAEKGYRGATTRDIAARAGVSEPMLFRHFGSKELLFERTAVDSVVGFMDDYVAEWSGRSHGETAEELELRDFLARLVAVMAQDRALLVAVVAGGSFDHELAGASERLKEAFGRVLSLFEGLVNEEFALRGLVTPDVEAFARTMLAVATGLALHADLLGIGTGDSLPMDRVIDEVVRVVVEGVRTHG